MIDTDSEFETIDLRSSKCDICRQEDNEPVIKCVLNDHYLRSLKGPLADRLKGIVEAHEVCIRKWLEVIEQDNTFTYSLQLSHEDEKQVFSKKPHSSDNKKIYRRFMDFIGRKEISESDVDVDNITFADPDIAWSSNENYLRESISSLDWSIDSFEVNDISFRGAQSSVGDQGCISSDKNVQSQTWEKLSINELRDLDQGALVMHLKSLRLTIEEKSKELIDELQLKDTLKQRTDGQKSLIEQLVHLQRKQ